MDSKQLVERLALGSIVIALGVMGLKLIAWRITGSVALYSDALESTVNVIASAAALWAIRVSHKPADRSHQHGHHKAEYFSAVLEGVLIAVAALLIIFRGLAELGQDPTSWPSLGRAWPSTAWRPLINASGPGF